MKVKTQNSVRKAKLKQKVLKLRGDVPVAIFNDKFLQTYLMNSLAEGQVWGYFGHENRSDISDAWVIGNAVALGFHSGQIAHFLTSRPARHFMDQFSMLGNKKKAISSLKSAIEHSLEDFTESNKDNERRHKREYKSKNEAQRELSEQVDQNNTDMTKEIQDLKAMTKLRAKLTQLGRGYIDGAISKLRGEILVQCKFRQIVQVQAILNPKREKTS